MNTCNYSYGHNNNINVLLISTAPCKETADPVHGFKRGQDFKHGGSVRFYCRGGYQRVGAASITCNDGKWNSQNPVCKGEESYFIFQTTCRRRIMMLQSC